MQNIRKSPLNVKKRHFVDNREEGKSDEDTSHESKTVKKLDTVLKIIKNNGRTTKPMSVKTCGSNNNLYPLIIKFINI